MFAPNTVTFVLDISFLIVHILRFILNCVTQYYNSDKAHNEYLPVSTKGLPISIYGNQIIVQCCLNVHILM